MAVLLGNGDGTFQTSQTYPFGGVGLQSLAIGDFNGDGNLDVLAASGNVALFLGNGDGTLASAQLYSVGGTFPVVADFNLDGKPDVALAADGATILLNIVTGFHYSTATTLSSAANPSGLGQSVSFTAVVAPAFGGPVSGNVTFNDGGLPLGTVPVNNNQAIFTDSALSLGTHQITAVYSGDSNFLPSTSAALNQSVEGAIAQVSPSILNFGEQTVGITGAAQVATLTNVGLAPLAITSLGMTGVNSEDFSQTNKCGHR